MTLPCAFDEEYFERGAVAGKSLYVNYRWLPELSLRLAHNIILKLGLNEETPILDYGCAKGYLVQSFRILDIPAYGCDISPYAISCASTEVAPYCHLVTRATRKLPPTSIDFDWIMTKDVLEHMTEKEIDRFLLMAKYRTKGMFHVIPMGNGSTFTVPEYARDPTHITAQPAGWWIAKFRQFGWTKCLIEFSSRGIKENWTKEYPGGDGIFTLTEEA